MITTSPKRGKSILIIDKNLPWRDWATEVLSEDGYIVDTATSLEGTRSALKKYKTDLILLSAEIAQKNIDLVKKLAKDNKQPAKFLVISPIWLTYSDLRLLWRAGVSDVQSKPRGRLKLLKLISQELGEGNKENSSLDTSSLNSNTLLTDCR